jgi:defect-in-organelle-trafficking protein DotC
MHLFPVVKKAAAPAAIFALVLLASAASFAQSSRQPTPDTSAAVAASNSIVPGAIMPNGQPVPAGVFPPGALGIGQPVGSQPFTLPRHQISEEEMAELLKDPDSAQSKARLLALQAEREGTILNFAKSEEKEEKETVTDAPIPPEMDALQQVAKTNADNTTISDEAFEEELMSLDLRRDAQKEAALSYGARGGLAKRGYQIAEQLKSYEHILDGVFNFRALLVQAPSGLLIEPPIIRESLDSILITANGNEAAVADRVLNINKQAKIVSAPRDWRNYINMVYETDIPPPPKVLWPKDAKEQAAWNGWVRQGWKAGYEQGEEAFEANLSRLTADYNGMVRYRMLLAEGMISQPYAMHEDRGVTGGKNEMRVGDRALRITGPSQFLTGSELWKPADR